jgi:hypothetical protein
MKANVPTELRVSAKAVIVREAKPSGGSDENAFAARAGGAHSFARFSRLASVG